MKKVVAIIICLLLCSGIVGGAVAWYNKSNPNDKPVIDNPIEQPDDNGGNTDNGENEQPSETPDETVDENALTVPANEALLVENRMVMQKGAQAYLGSDESSGNALRFSLLVDNSLIEEIENNENLSLTMMVAPVKYFDQVNTENYTYIDWFTIFTEKEAPVELVEITNYSDKGDTQTTVNFKLTNIPYGGINMEIVAMGVLVDNSGETPVYTYSKMPTGETYRSNARSLAYVAGATLNAVALGEVTYDEAVIAKLNSFVNMSVDRLNGLTEPTDYSSKPVITIANGNTVSVKTMEAHKIELTISSVGLDMPIRFISTDTNIATVSENGVITGVNIGTTSIKVCIAGVISTVSVTVTNNA